LLRRLLDTSKTVIAQFLFADGQGAEVALGAMFKTLKDVVAISVTLRELP
jgi:hypothetical protein